MKTFRKKWDGVAVEDGGCYMTKEAKSFVTAFRNMLKRELPDCEITVKPGHYDLYGFIKKGDKFIYVSYSVPRYGEKIQFSGNSCRIEQVLYRTAKDDHDYHGGTNNYCFLEETPECVNALFSRM